MRKTSLAVLCAVVMAALTLTAYAAAAKSYQFTGVVKSVDAGTFTVQKSASETWEFSTRCVHERHAEGWRQSHRPVPG